MRTELPWRAAQYVRMSTEHQNYSMVHQTEAIARYAALNGFEVVATYQDPATSGLRLENRPGLKALLAEVLGGSARFSAVLVYDVSRWGRFQDLDESAHYEFVCRQAGAPIIYCAEPFDPAGGMINGIVKQLKRAMAAEYSRELSIKVSEAKRGLMERGFWTGGRCSYGFRRAMISPDGEIVRLLEDGERKALQGHRVVLVAGPDTEVEVVRRVFREFAIHGLGTPAIARRLRDDGVVANGGAAWTRGRVRRMLMDEQYRGVLVSGRRSRRLNSEVHHPPSAWRRLPGGCPELVSSKLFDLAHQNLRRPVHLGSDEDMLDELRRVLKARGRLSATIIRQESRHGVWSYTRRFGSLGAAYQRVGYAPGRAQVSALARRQQIDGAKAPWNLPDEVLMSRLEDLLERRGKLTCTLIDEAPELPCASVVKKRLGAMPELWRRLGCEPSARQVRSAELGARRARGESKSRFILMRIADDAGAQGPD